MDLDNVRQSLRAHLADTIGTLRAKALEHAPDALEREAGYTIHNTGDVSVVRIYDEIWWLGVNAQDLASDLDSIQADRIRVEINSPGGDVFDGIAIYNALRAHPAHVTTRVDGIAASIASVIAQAGDTRQMMGGSQMMIHNAWGVTVGDRTDHEDMSALLAQQDDIIAGIYATASGGDRDHFRALMDAETWLSADRAVEEGLADEIVELGRGDKPQDRAPTLQDEITGAMDVVTGVLTSAERVAALRAEAGKRLSVVNLEGLVGLRDALTRLDDLLTNDTEDISDVAAAEFARFVALTQGV